MLKIEKESEVEIVVIQILMKQQIVVIINIVTTSIMVFNALFCSVSYNL